MKKNKKLLNIVVILFIILASTYLIFIEGYGDLDELWQYSFAKNIVEGKLPYRDFNLVATPLHSTLGALFLKIFSNQLFTMRFFNLIIFAGILIIAYKIFLTLNISQYKSAFFTGILYFLFYYDLGVEYNYLVLLIVLLSLFLELRRINKSEALEINIKYDVLSAILVGLTILTKHTIGIIVCLMYIFYKAVFIKNKQDFQVYKKIVLCRILGVSIPVLTFILYLLITHSWNQFINYAILGVMEFENHESYLNLIQYKNILISVFSVLVPMNLICFLSALKYRTNKKTVSLFVLGSYSIAMFAGNYPISNPGHFIIYSFIGIMTVLYCIDKTMYLTIKNKKCHIFIEEGIKFFAVFCTIGYLTFACISFIYYYRNNHICQKDELLHYANIIMSENSIKNIKEVNEYILKKKQNNITVLILDSAATAYMIPIDEYHKNYDLFNKGNLGKDGEVKMIEEIKNAADTEYLLLKDEFALNWQSPMNIINYVKENKEKIGEVSKFDIYH